MGAKVSALSLPAEVNQIVKEKKGRMSYLRWVMTIVPRRTPAYSPVSMI